MRREPFPRRLARHCLNVLWGLGGGAGLFLLLCAAGVVEPAVLSSAEPEPALTAAAWTAPEPKRFRAALLDPEDLDRAVRAAEGRDGVVIPMKGPDGKLAWVSALPQAADSGGSWALPARNEAIRAMNETKGLYTVAKISCFRDDTLAKACPSLALKRDSGSPWRDREGHCWLDPSEPGVLSWCAGLCRELAELGFDEILLTDCAFPTGEGTEDLILPAEPAAVLERFSRQLQKALKEYPVVLSIEAVAAEDGPDPDSGQTPALLASFSGGVWTADGSSDALAAFSPSVIPLE